MSKTNKNFITLKSEVVRNYGNRNRKQRESYCDVKYGAGRECLDATNLSLNVDRMPHGNLYV